MTAAVSNYGGHDAKFIEEVPERLTCYICTKAFRDPQLAVCCGQHFCDSCLEHWFKKHGKSSCPHCRAEGEQFQHVPHKGLKSEVIQLKVRCSHEALGCEWTGELGSLPAHLESSFGCQYVMVECSNRCMGYDFDERGYVEKVVQVTRKDLEYHLKYECKLRLYQCEHCGHRDTYNAIAGYKGHYLTCPDFPLQCTNRCGVKEVKRKDMDTHCNQCPKEKVPCPFKNVGCSTIFPRCDLDTHVKTNQGTHLEMAMIAYREKDEELSATRKSLASQRQQLDELADKKEKVRHMTYWLEFANLSLEQTHLTNLVLSRDVKFAKELLTGKVRKQLTHAQNILSTTQLILQSTSKLLNKNDQFVFCLPQFSLVKASGDPWYSPTFYYKEGYKMCLKINTQGGRTGGEYVCVSLVLLKGEQDEELEWPIRDCGHLVVTLVHHVLTAHSKRFNVCQHVDCTPLDALFQLTDEDRRIIESEEKFVLTEMADSLSMSDILMFSVEYGLHHHNDF